MDKRRAGEGGALEEERDLNPDLTHPLPLFYYFLLLLEMHKGKWKGKAARGAVIG